MSIEIDEIILATLCCVPFLVVAIGCLALALSDDSHDHCCDERRLPDGPTDNPVTTTGQNAPFPKEVA